MREIIPFNQPGITLEQVFENIDALVREAVEEGSVESVVVYLSQLIKAKELVGKSLAQFLHQIHANWKFFIESESDEFKDYMAAVIGLHPHTVERYVRIAELDEKAPEEYVPKLRDMNVDELFPVANAVSQGYYLDDEDWKDYVSATTAGERREIIRDVKGKPPRKYGVEIWLDRRGSLWAFQSDYDRLFIGSLEIDNDNIIVKKAINRIISEARIREE